MITSMLLATWPPVVTHDFGTPAIPMECAVDAFSTETGSAESYTPLP